MADEETGTGTTETQTIIAGGTGTETVDTQTKTDGIAAPQAPEKYELTAPEGVALQPGLLGKFEELFRKNNLTNEAAQELINSYAENIIKPDQVSLQEQLAKQHETWKETVAKDTELGGTNFPNTEKFAQSAVAKFGTPELKTYLNTTGLGSHPELVRAFARIGKAMAEDSIVSGKHESVNSLLELYPTMKPNN